MTIGQSYKPAMPLEEAFSEILQLAGTNYDPKAVIGLKNAWILSEIQEIADQNHLVSKNLE